MRGALPENGGATCLRTGLGRVREAPTRVVGVKPGGEHRSQLAPGGSLASECEQRWACWSCGARSAPGWAWRYPSCRRRRHRSGVSWVQGRLIPAARETIHVCARAPLGSKEESGLVQPVGHLPAGEGSPGLALGDCTRGWKGSRGPRLSGQSSYMSVAAQTADLEWPPGPGWGGAITEENVPGSLSRGGERGTQGNRGPSLLAQPDG